ncbi:MAG: hypothetical protein JWM68_5062 [Verrucomicrobiales bacterium]|nr:hypothetical protein [Verrucomicrobiales bacterium]
MKTFYKPAIALVILFIGFTASAQQIKTWMCPKSSAGSFTNTLAANQVMEILSASFEPDSQIEVTIGTDKLMMGNGGATLNTPMVLAGPAIIIFKKTSTGGLGTIISYRITPQPR